MVVGIDFVFGSTYNTKAGFWGEVRGGTHDFYSSSTGRDHSSTSPKNFPTSTYIFSKIRPCIIQFDEICSLQQGTKRQYV